MKKCIAIIEVFANTKFSKDWNISFQKSILSQWSECHKLTGKQFEAIMNKIDSMEYSYTYFDLLEDIEKKIEQARYIENWTQHNQLIGRYKNDERFHEAIKMVHEGAIKRHGKKYYIIEYKYWQDEDNSFMIVNNTKLEELKEESQEEDPDTKIINIIEVI